MPTLDDYVEGTFDSNNPANVKEIECEPQTELEEQQEWNQELVRKNKKLKSELSKLECALDSTFYSLQENTNLLSYKISQLEKLAEIEQCLSVFGTLTYEQLKEKQEILNQYIK